MTEVKYVVNDPKIGKSYQKTMENMLLNKKIGEKIEGNSLGLRDYELQIMGGSDNAGFPMRPEIQTSGRKRLILKRGDIGARINVKGMKNIKTVRGNTISDQTAQINMKVVKYGSKPITELWNIAEKKKEEAPQGEKAPETK